MFFNCFSAYQPSYTSSYTPSYTPSFGSYQPAYVAPMQTPYIAPLAQSYTTNSVATTPFTNPTATANTGMFGDMGNLNNILNYSLRLNAYAAQMQMTSAILNMFTNRGKSTSNASSSKVVNKDKDEREDKNEKPLLNKV